jgi:hypothetical protein
MKVCLGARSPLECIYCRQTEGGCGSSRSIINLISERNFGKCQDINQNCNHCNISELCDILRDALIQETDDAISLHRLIINYFKGISDDQTAEQIMLHAFSKEALNSIISRMKSMSVEQMCQFINGNTNKAAYIPLYIVKLMTKN